MEEMVALEVDGCAALAAPIRAARASTFSALRCDGRRLRQRVGARRRRSQDRAQHRWCSSLPSLHHGVPGLERCPTIPLVNARGWAAAGEGLCGRTAASPALQHTAASELVRPDPSPARSRASCGIIGSPASDRQGAPPGSRSGPGSAAATRRGAESDVKRRGGRGLELDDRRSPPSGPIGSARPRRSSRSGESLSGGAAVRARRARATSSP